MSSRPVSISHDELASVLPPGGLTLVSSCSAQSNDLLDMTAQAGNRLGDMCFTGIFVPGLNTKVWQAGESSRVLTFFQTPQLRDLGERAVFLPLSYGQIRKYFAQNPPDAVMFMCAPPDRQGMCSFGTECSFVADLWESAKTRIAHVNPAMPIPPGFPGIPWSEIDAYCETEQPLLSVPASDPDPLSQQIATHLAPYVGDGATLQTGLGKVPDALLDQLHDRKALTMHSGLIGDGVARLARSGALAGPGSILAGTAIGSEALYGAIAADVFDFQPVSITHNVARIGAYPAFVALNSALEVDLYGQAYAEVSPKGAMSGPGGAFDYAMAARLSPNGLSVVALPSSAKGGQISRIAIPSQATGPVALNRLVIDLVVTEHGVADFRNASHQERAERLIEIAAPQFRSELQSAWSDIEKNL